VSEPRLEWVNDERDGWRAKVGRFHLLAWCHIPNHGYWEVVGDRNGIVIARIREPDSMTVEDCKLAAEDALRSLLIEALVPFASEPLPHGYTVREIDESEAGEEAPLVMLSDECTDEVFTCEDAEAIGVALIAAAHASRHHGKAGGG
jgi:hypothetical protein